MPMRRDKVRLGRRDWALLAVVPLIVLAFLWRLCLAGQILYGPDAFAYFYPLYEYASERVLSGELPLWNPHLFLGAPFLANPQAGVLYPVHWVLAGLPAPSLASASLALHYCVAVGSTYLLARLGLGHKRLPALGAGLAFGVSGLLGAQAEHFNQVEVLSWLPLQALALEMGAIRRSGPVGRRRLWLLAGIGLSAAQLLSGHSQAAYIAHATLAAYGAVRVLSEPGTLRARGTRWAGTLLFVGLSAAGGAALAAVQLLPTLELAGLSVRAGGLPYRQAASFSFSPRSWLLGLLPHYGSETPFSEYIAYFGVTGLALAAIGAWRAARGRRWGAGLVALGMLLALGGYNPLYYVLYRLVPGMDLFRAPARWLVMAVLGASLLVAEGLEVLGAGGGRLALRRVPVRVLLLAVAVLAGLWLIADPRPQGLTIIGWLATGLAFTGAVSLLPARAAPAAAVGLLVAELFVASQRLPYNLTTAPYVYEAQRRSTQVLTQVAGLNRYLSVCDPEFDAGDMGDLISTLGRELSADGQYGLLVGAKSTEVLSRDLALKWGLYALDGYDGGVLPTADHTAFQSLFLPAERVAADGRMSEALEEVPADRLLALASVGYVLQDRLEDVWLEGIYYDLSVEVSSGAEVSVPDFPATDLGLVLAAPQDAPGSEGIRITLDDRLVAEARMGSEGPVVVGGGTNIAAEPVPGRPGLWYAKVPLSPAPGHYTDLGVQPAPGDGGIALAGASLINSAAGTGAPIALSQAAGLVPVHLGDLRVSRVERTLPRAYFTSCVTAASDQASALDLLRDPGFDPRRETVLVGEGGSRCEEEGWLEAQVVAYEPERVVIEVDAPRPGYLVLTDSYYPGWQAMVDGAATTILRANGFFRAVALDEGPQRVEFVFRPSSLGWGALISGLTAVVLAVAGVWWLRAK
jgi:hypothetical protein